MVQRIMVATALLYDNIHPVGAFVKDSPIPMALIVHILEDEAGVKRKRSRSKTTPPLETKEE